jgi:hypothetical protein
MRAFMDNPNQPRPFWFHLPMNSHSPASSSRAKPIPLAAHSEFGDGWIDALRSR